MIPLERKTVNPFFQKKRYIFGEKCGGNLVSILFKEERIMYNDFVIEKST